MRAVSSHELWCDKLSLSRLTLAYTAAWWSADYEVGKCWTLSNSSPFRVWSAANYVSHIMVEEVRPISTTSAELHSPDLPWGGSGLSPLSTLPPETEQTAVEIWMHTSFYSPHWVRQMGDWVWQQTLSLQSFSYRRPFFFVQIYIIPFAVFSSENMYKYILNTLHVT